MSIPRKGLLATAVATLGCLFCLAMTASALGATAIHFQRESLAALEKQLHSHEVHALVFHPNPAPGHIHASLNNGAHMSIVYASSEQAHLVALANAEGTRVTVATKSTTAKKTVHHKLRYIAGGILVAVIIVVAVVLLVDRRRKLRETADGGGGGAPAPSSPGDAS
jgi:cytochrome bd-type quinol oxidase subunit 1